MAGLPKVEQSVKSGIRPNPEQRAWDPMPREWYEDLEKILGWITAILFVFLGLYLAWHFMSGPSAI